MMNILVKDEADVLFEKFYGYLLLQARIASRIPMPTYHPTITTVGTTRRIPSRRENRGLLTPVLKPFLLGSLKKYRPVQAESVARFMVKVAHEEPITGLHI